jgi:hypothetical protein
MPRTINDNYRKIIIIGEDGFYKLEKSDWQKAEYKMDEGEDSDAVATVTLLKEAGSYLAFVDPEIATGAGYACTVVNLQAILREAKARNGG